jgi:hypothetical protein
MQRNPAGLELWQRKTTLKEARRVMIRAFVHAVEFPTLTGAHRKALQIDNFYSKLHRNMDIPFHLKVIQNLFCICQMLLWRIYEGEVIKPTVPWAKPHQLSDIQKVLIREELSQIAELHRKCGEDHTFTLNKWDGIYLGTLTSYSLALDVFDDIYHDLAKENG